MNTQDSLTSQLHARGYRLTPQRLAILKVLEGAENHLTPIDVYQHAREVIPGITEATVYRTLSFLSEQGLALEAHIGNGQLVYVNLDHSHLHVICRECGEMLETDCETIRTFVDHFRSETGYWIDVSHLTLFGLCPECQEVSQVTGINPCDASDTEE